jgi:hypothetical protein
MNKIIFLLIAFIFLASSNELLAVSNPSAKKGKILVVISSESELELREGKRYKTGYFLNELTVPVKRLIEEGYAIDFANPKGNKPAMDLHSDSASFFNNNESKYREIKAFHDELKNLQSPKKLADVLKSGLDQYDAVFFPGGHAPMQDLLHSQDVKFVLNHFADSSLKCNALCVEEYLMGCSITKSFSWSVV